MTKEYNHLVELCQWRAREKPEQRAYTYLIDGEEEEVSMSYGGLHRWAVTIAQQLQRHGAPRARALLLYPPGLEYIQAFFACLYAGVIAVPAYPPDPNRLERTMPRLLSIIKDSGAKIILTTEMIQSMASFLTAQAPELTDLQWIATDTLPLKTDSQWQGPEIQSSDLAFLQYTSGSTGSPKGVMLSHENLLYNSRVIQQHFGNVETSHDVSWLPPYHDMGLIGDIIGTIYCGGAMTIINPLHFLQKPVRWLKAISRKKADISGGPNFAYQLCLRKVTAEDKKQLDLSSWEQAYCGAEPIARATLEQFAEAFAPCGFRKEFLYPCYGLAEGTLLVAGNERTGGFRFKQVSKKKFQERQVAQTPRQDGEETLTYVACGAPMAGQQIKIVRPDTLELCPDGEVGEIWLSGPSVARGYWNQPELTRKTFAGISKSDPADCHLRTGDLGFMENGQLYVTGRIKDLIIIRGANHYPQDIERSVEACHSTVRPGCVAAFSVPLGFEEGLVLALEVDSARGGAAPSEAAFFQEITQAIVATVGKDFELETHAICLMAKGAIPKTSSGKLRRSAVREGFLGKTLDLVYEWRRETGKIVVTQVMEMEEEVPSQSRQAVPELDLPPIPENIRPWLIEKVTRHLGMRAEEFDPGRPFSDYGLASKDAVELSGDLGDWLGSRFSPALLWKYPSVETLAKHLGEAPPEIPHLAKHS
jgi:acyl-CoA synthetase (AMP-forming)/AMP-acid ligase II/acyl carrier protein